MQAVAKAPPPAAGKLPSAAPVAATKKPAPVTRVATRVPAAAAPRQELTIVPSRAHLRFTARGETTALTARVLDQRTKRPVQRTSILWRSASPSVATVSASGQVAAVNNGSTQLWAVSGRDSVAIPVTVQRSAARLGFSPDRVFLDAVGTYQIFKVDVRDARDNPLPGDRRSMPVCRIRDDYVAILAPDGRLTARNNGLTWVYCQRGELRDSLRVEVRQRAARAQIVSDGPSFVLKSVGDSLRLAMIAVDRMGETIIDGWVTWISEEPAIAHVDVSTGVVIGTSVGSTTILGRIDGIEDSITVTVREPLSRAAMAARARDRIPSRLPLPVGVFATPAPDAASAAAAVPESTRPPAPAQPLDRVTRLELLPRAGGVGTKPGDTVLVTAIARNYRNDLLTGKTVLWSTPDTALGRMLPDGRLVVRDTGRITVVGAVGDITARAVVNARPAGQAADGATALAGNATGLRRPASAPAAGSASRATGLSAANPRNQFVVDSIIRTTVIGSSTMRIRTPRRSISITPVAGYAERRVDDRDTSDTAAPLKVGGLVYGAQLDVAANRFVALQGSFITGTLTPLAGLKQTVAEVNGNLGVAVLPWLALNLGTNYRGFARAVATDRWLTVRTGGEVRMNFVGGTMRGTLGASYLPVVKIDGVNASPKLGLGAAAGLDYHTRRFTAGVRYEAERYDFPDPTPTTKHLEQFSSLRLRMGLLLGRY